MRATTAEPLYVSRNHLEGSLCDTSIDRLLAACRKHLVTGVIRVHTRGKDGVLELRAGAVSEANLGDLGGDLALLALRDAADGWYELAQKLPDLTGDLASGAQLEGDVEGVPLIAIMRHCEDHALTCLITVISGFDRAVIEYRAGDIARVELNGFFDDDALPQVVKWPDARFRIASPPLDLEIDGWPVPRRAPTVPEKIQAPAPKLVKPPSDAVGEILNTTPLIRAVAQRLPTPTPASSRRASTIRPFPSRRRDWSRTGDVLWLVAVGALVFAIALAAILYAA